MFRCNHSIFVVDLRSLTWQQYLDIQEWCHDHLGDWGTTWVCEDLDQSNTVNLHIRDEASWCLFLLRWRDVLV